MFLSPQILKNCLFLDIETVPVFASFDALSEEMQGFWIRKSQGIARETVSGEKETPEQTFEGRAGIYAEFAKVICVSVGYIRHEEDGSLSFRIKSFAGDDEKELLSGFSDLLVKHYNNPEKYFLSGHNIKEFDIPFLCRRMVIHGVPFPAMLDISGKKPWQTQHLLDTMDMWRFGDFKSYTSLGLLAATLNIPSPKDDIDGSMVGHVYWKEGDLDRIVRYCEKDVATVMKIMMKYAGMDLSLIKD
ncbi:MAG: 3'-5' exonuclease [Saprospiraceae bacterium]|nr:3'-5' exonuclease [Saprospiraceae bacterium]